MPFFKAKEQAPALAVDFDHLPRHIAIIMDGNGRWAQKRGLPRTAGHAAGAENFRTIATYCKDIGLEYRRSTPSPLKTGSAPRRKWGPSWAC